MCEYMEKRWLYNEAPAETVGILCEKLHISTVLATAMVNRGITDPAAGNRFLYDTVESLADPFLLPARRRPCRVSLTRWQRGKDRCLR